MNTPSAADIFERVDRHDFHSINNGFTVDPESGYDGVPDLDNEDWRINTLALRDLVRLGSGASSELRQALGHDNEYVRQIAAVVLGIVRAEDAIDDLAARLLQDPDPVVRSQAAISLGQIGRPTEVLHEQAEAEDHQDVLHQIAIARDRIRKKEPVDPVVAERIAALDESAFQRVTPGDPAPNFTLNDTNGNPWHLADFLGEKTVVLLWIFADWCPVCHKEFHGLIKRAGRFRELDVEVATIECHDRYRSRVMTGESFRPEFWFAEHFPDNDPQKPYPEEIWWPHLSDPGASVGVRYGIHPWQFTVHSEWVNRPTTIIIDPYGAVQLAYVGHYWGDRPTIGQILKMIETGTYEFNAPPLKKGPH